VQPYRRVEERAEKTEGAVRSSGKRQLSERGGSKVVNRDFLSSVSGFVFMQVVAVLFAVVLIYFSGRKRR
jgi:hypothetical protein